MKIGVIVGHEKKAQGAVLHRSILSKLKAPFSAVTEYQYNSEIAQLMHRYASTIEGVDMRIIMRDNVGISGAYRKARAEECSCVIELHFNSYNAKAFGTETLCSREEVDKSFAQAVHEAICRVFGRSGAGNRGLKILGANDRGGGNVVSYPGRANALVEPAFADNPSEAKMLIERKEEYARALVDAAIGWIKAKAA